MEYEVLNVTSLEDGIQVPHGIYTKNSLYTLKYTWVYYTPKITEIIQIWLEAMVCIHVHYLLKLLTSSLLSFTTLLYFASWPHSIALSFPPSRWTHHLVSSHSQERHLSPAIRGHWILSHMNCSHLESHPAHWRGLSMSQCMEEGWSWQCLITFLHWVFIASTLLFFPSHSPQSLPTPFNITLVPTNDNSPTLAAESTTFSYVENAVIHILPDVVIEDVDETCQDKLLIAAQVTMETMADDNEYEQLNVSKW